MPVASHLLVLVLLTAVPLWDVWDARRLRRGGVGREGSYLAIIVVLWALTFWVLSQHPLGSLLAAPGAFLSRGVSFAVTAAILLGLLAPVAASVVHAPTRAQVVAASAGAAYMLPRTTREMALFAAVSVTAGICEEVIFRAFLPRYFMAEPFGFPALLAAVVAAVAFGVAHAGQGWRGMGMAAAAALFFSGMYHATGTLLVPILLHAVVDLRAIPFACFARHVPQAAPAV